jgi:hypothetical protein
MTDTEWLASADPEAMLTHLGEKISNRQLWLFGCACCRRIWHALTDGRSRAVIEFRERQDNGLASEEEVQAASVAAGEAIDDSTSKTMEGLDFETVMGPDSPWDRRAAEAAPDFATKAAASATEPATAGWLAALASGHVAEVIRCLHSGDKVAAYNHERAAHGDLLRDVVGNPFRPVVLNPAHRTPTIVSLAEAAYNERLLPGGHLSPDRLSVLADALEEAGCTGRDILDHLRSPGPHVRGCWAVDLVLARE